MMTTDTKDAPPVDYDSDAMNGDTPPAEDEGSGRKRKKRADAGQARGPRKGTKRASAIAGKLKSGINLAAAVVSSRDMFSGRVLEHNAPKLADAWAPVIANNPRLVQVLNQLEKGGHLGAAIFATLTTALPIIAYHRPDLFPVQLRALAISFAPPDAQNMAAQSMPQSDNYNDPATSYNAAV